MLWRAHPQFHNKSAISLETPKQSKTAKEHRKTRISCGTRHEPCKMDCGNEGGAANKNVAVKESISDRRLSPLSAVAAAAKARARENMRSGDRCESHSACFEERLARKLERAARGGRGDSATAKNDDDAAKKSNIDRRPAVSTGTADAAAKAWARENLPAGDRREPTPASFEERLARKLERGARGGRVDSTLEKTDDDAMKKSNIDRRRAPSMSAADAAAKARAREKMSAGDRREPQPASFEERLSRTLELSAGGGRGDSAPAKTNDDAVKKSNIDRRLAPMPAVDATAKAQARENMPAEDRRKPLIASFEGRLARKLELSAGGGQGESAPARNNDDAGKKSNIDRRIAPPAADATSKAQAREKMPAGDLREPQAASFEERLARKLELSAGSGQGDSVPAKNNADAMKKATFDQRLTASTGVADATTRARAMHSFEERLARKLDPGAGGVRNDPMPAVGRGSRRKADFGEAGRYPEAEDTMGRSFSLIAPTPHNADVHSAARVDENSRRKGHTASGADGAGDSSINEMSHSRMLDDEDSNLDTSIVGSLPPHQEEDDGKADAGATASALPAVDGAQATTTSLDDNGETNIRQSHPSPSEVVISSPLSKVADEEIQAVDIGSHLSQTILEEAPDTGGSCIYLDDVMHTLQRLKEERGNFVMNRSSVSFLINELSSQDTEPFVRSSIRPEEARPHGLIPGVQASVNWSRMERNITMRENSQSNAPGQAMRASVNWAPRVSDVSQSSTTRLSGQRPRQTVRGRLSTLFFGNGHLIEATLVEEDGEGEVVVAEPVGYFEMKLKRIAGIMFAMLALLAVLLSLTLTNVIRVREASDESGPPLPPVFDSRSTFEIVRSRGRIRCGTGIRPLSEFHTGLCRSIAAVIIGNADSYEEIPVTTAKRFEALHDKVIDTLIDGTTKTIEREVREKSTGSGFTFSSAYNYDGMVYAGIETFVMCAEEYKRYDECSALSMCATMGSTHHDFLKTTYPSKYFKVLAIEESPEMKAMLLNGTCNVAANERTYLGSLFKDEIGNGDLILGDKVMTKEPLTIATRNDDREFSDIVNWVLQALFYGEEQGLKRNPALCRNSPPHDASDLYFMNAVYCVGNFGEIWGTEIDRGMNQINNGTGMIYAIPFGDLAKREIGGTAGGSTMPKITKMGSLNCGVVVPDNFDGNVTESDALVGMGVDYCRTLVAALFIGDPYDVNIYDFRESDNSSYVALANGEIDVLVGAKIQRGYDFEFLPSLGGLHFSTPYYYGNESASRDVSFYSIATREDDVLFSSFVDCIVLATIYAQENEIDREKSNQMPLVSVFGSDLYWALKDAIAYSGSYDQIYAKHFGSQVSEEDRERNTLNDGGPMILSFPHLP